MTDDLDVRELERRLARYLHAAAPQPAPDFADRVLRETTHVPQRGPTALHFFPLLAASVVVALAVIAGLGIANLLPTAPRVGEDVTPPAATADPTEAAPSVTPDATSSDDAAAASPSADPTADWPRCENRELGFAVSYPPNWWVQQAARPNPDLDPLPGCTYFAPEPVDIGQNAGLPAEVAIVFGFTEEPLGNFEQPLRIVSSRELEVADRSATVEEVEWTEDTVFQAAGERAYGYQVPLANGQVLAAGVGSAAGDYEEEKRVLDEMMGTLELLDR